MINYFCEDLKDLETISKSYNYPIEEYFRKYMEGDYTFPILVWERGDGLAHQPWKDDLKESKYFEILKNSIHIKSGKTIKEYFPEYLI